MIRKIQDRAADIADLCRRFRVRPLALFGPAALAGFSQPITHCRRIVAFRNQLVYGYRTIRDDVVWTAIHNALSLLEREATELVRGASQP